MLCKPSHVTPAATRGSVWLPNLTKSALLRGGKAEIQKHTFTQRTPASTGKR